MREHYKRAKAQLYPRPQLQPSLKRINSGEEWDGTASFHQPWRCAGYLQLTSVPCT